MLEAPVAALPDGLSEVEEWGHPQGTAAVAAGGGRQPQV